MYNTANKFIIDNNTKDKFIANADSQGLDITHLTPLGENDPYIQFLGQSNTRDIIKWAWSHEVGDVSGVFEVGDSYIVGTLVNAVDGEYAPLSEEYVSNQVLRKAKNEACAKKFAEELAKEDNFSSADTVNINFMRNGVPGIGHEPKLVAAISALPVDAVSDAIIGEMGVYKVKVLNENPSSSKANIQMLNRDLKGMVANRMYESLRKDADVSDNRSNFY
jgi:peptidyl-prolyl cis-trans isomerase D